MSNVELISFILTIASFIISTLLGLFAIWLTKYFDSKTSETLKDVKDLTSEIKNLTNTSINHQENMTSKMLEKILNPSPYGIDTSTTKNEKGNDNNLENLLKNLINSQNQKIDELKEQVTKINQITNVENDETDLLFNLIKFNDFPAFYVLLNAIYQENITNTSDLEHVQRKYGFPSRFEGGVSRLIEEKILIGTDESFEINPKYHKSLSKWLIEQQKIIKEIGSIFKQEIDNELSEDEKDENDQKLRRLTKELRFRSSKKTMVAKLKHSNT